MLEKNFQTNVMKFLRENGAYVINIWGGGFQSVGIPDLIINYKGNFLALELKVKPNKASAIQKKHVELINIAGGDGYVFYYSTNWKEDLLNILKQLEQK